MGEPVAYHKCAKECHCGSVRAGTKTVEVKTASWVGSGTQSQIILKHDILVLLQFDIVQPFIINPVMLQEGSTKYLQSIVMG